MERSSGFPVSCPNWGRNKSPLARQAIEVLRDKIQRQVQDGIGRKGETAEKKTWYHGRNIIFVDGATHSLAGNLLILSYSPSHGSHGDLFQCGKAGLLLVIRIMHNCTIART